MHYLIGRSGTCANNLLAKVDNLLHFIISCSFRRSHTDCLAMMVYFPLLSISQCFNVCLHDDVNEWLEEVEEEPDVDHLDIGRLGEIVADVDKHGCQYEHDRHIQGDHSLKFKCLRISIHSRT